MPTREHSGSVKTTLLAIALLLASASAQAQAVFTSVNLDGHKTFSDRPDTAPEPEAEVAPAIAARRAPAGTMAKGSRGAARVNSNEAQRRLAQAQLNRKRGMSPLATEQTRAAGSAALPHRYWQRQEYLRLQVETAQQRLNATREPLLARR